MGHRIAITVLVIVNALFPKESGGAFPGSFPGTGYIPVPREDIPCCLAGLDRAIGADGTLKLFFSGCSALAAPFLLFRLKRKGYSSCRATASRDGLRIEARR